MSYRFQDLRPAVAFALALALALLWSSAGVGAQTETAGTLLPIPVVDLRGVDDAVRTQIEEQRRLLEEALAAGPPAEEDAARLGLLFGEAGQLYLVYDLLPAARACLANAAELQPQNFRWRYLLGSAAEHLGELEAAHRGLRAGSRT